MSRQPYYDLYQHRKSLWQQLSDLADELYEKGSEVPGQLERWQEKANELISIETYWAYPGLAVLKKSISYANNFQYALLKQLLNNVYVELRSQSYRQRVFDPYFDPLDHLNKPRSAHLNEMPPKDTEQNYKTYFEVLVVHPDPAEYRNHYKESIAMHRRARDGYVYDLVFVNNTEDAITAVLGNPNILACAYVEGFELSSPHDYFNRYYSKFLNNTNLMQSIADEPLTGLRRTIDYLRPELSHYFITEVSPAEVHRTVRDEFDRVLHNFNLFQELHRAILSSVQTNYSTPFFDALRSYSKKPKGVFHALPISRGASVRDSNWIGDMLEFYGPSIFLAETSSTQGGLDSLLDPKGAIKQSAEKAAKTFGAQETFFVTNGTSTANKIVMQANINPGDIVLTSSDCHKSIPYSIMLSGAHPIYLETYPLDQYDLYGAVTLDQIKSVLLELKGQGLLHRVKQISLTNCTFDGIVHNVERFMLDILAIKPSIIFHWDEAWFAHGHFNPIYKHHTAMNAAQLLQERFASAEYKSFYQQWYGQNQLLLENNNEWMCKSPLYPDPSLAQVRVYATQSTHKTLTSFRQGSMIHVTDAYTVRQRLVEAYRIHTSTSPNYQIIASLDVGRRQMALEGYERVQRAIRLAHQLRYQINSKPVISRYFKALSAKDLIPQEQAVKTPWRVEPGNYFVDPTRVTVDISATKMDGAHLRELLISHYDIQVNKTSRKTVLFIVNIGVNENTITYLVQVLSEIANRLQAGHDTITAAVTTPYIALPRQRQFHPSYTSFQGLNHSAVDLRRAYYDAYEDNAVEHLTLNEETLAAVKKRGRLCLSIVHNSLPPWVPSAYARANYYRRDFNLFENNENKRNSRL